MYEPPVDSPVVCDPESFSDVVDACESRGISIENCRMWFHMRDGGQTIVRTFDGDSPRERLLCGVFIGSLPMASVEKVVIERVDS